jgi:dihydrofolate reductase
VFVLTHHERASLQMVGGTTFHFVTEGIEAALERANAVAGEWCVAIAGGAATVNQYLAAGLIDELRLRVVPVLLGAGERLLEGAPNAELELLGQPRGTALVTQLRYRVLRRARRGAGRSDIPWQGIDAEEIIAIVRVAFTRRERGRGRAAGRWLAWT